MVSVIALLLPSAILSGMYTGDNSPDDQTLFITEKRCFDDLMTGLASSCSECLVRSCWRLDSVIQVVCFSLFYVIVLLAN